MSWELSDDHEMLRATVREFAEQEIAPHAADWDRSCHFPIDVVHAMGDLGLFGIVFPERWGGGGGDFASSTLTRNISPAPSASLAVMIGLWK